MKPDPDPERALDAVAHFCVALAQSPTPATYRALVAERPDLVEDLLDFLRAHLVEGRSEGGLARFDGDPLFWELAGHLAAGATEAQRQRLLDEIAFRVAHPEALRVLAPLLRVVLTPEEAEAVLLARARGHDAEAARLAHELAYFLFGGAEDYPLSAAGRAVFDLG